MGSIGKEFQALLERLHDLINESEYIPDFDFVGLMKALKSEVVLLDSDTAQKGINKCLSLINNIAKGDLDFFSRFRIQEVKREESKDEYGNICYEESRTYIPLPDWKRHSVNNEIIQELQYYVTVLKQMSNFTIYDDGGKQRPLPKEEKTNRRKGKSVTSSLKFTYLHVFTSPGKVRALFYALKKHKFIHETVHYKDFKKVFMEENMPPKRIYWTGGVSGSGLSTLKQFVKYLFNAPNLIDQRANKWIVAKALFTTNEDGSEIKEDLKGQKVSIQEKELLNNILREFSRE